MAITQGAARAYAESNLGGPCDEVESYPIAIATVTAVCQGNGDRVGLMIMNVGPNPIFLGLLPSVSAAGGLSLAALGGVMILNVVDDFTLPTRTWYAIAPTGNSALYVLQIVRQGLTAGG